jgi:hypothetical protein
VWVKEPAAPKRACVPVPEARLGMMARPTGDWFESYEPSGLRCSTALSGGDRDVCDGALLGRQSCVRMTLISNSVGQSSQ